MEPYDVKSKCPKCDWPLLHTEYHGVSFEEEGCTTLLCEFPGQEEHIVRTCAKCGYEFFQKPIEKAVAASTVLLEEPTEMW